MTSIAILLGTFNGARFLPDQLRSFENQTFANWRLFASDDGSTDATVAILS
ncbi:MAG: glycosyltransferase, partial [Steroidobacteraceae bacterium]